MMMKRPLTISTKWLLSCRFSVAFRSLSLAIRRCLIYWPELGSRERGSMDQAAARKTTVADDEYPAEVKRQMEEFSDTMQQFKTSLTPLLENYSELESRLNDASDRAMVDLTTVYALNTLYWGEYEMEHADDNCPEKENQSGNNPNCAASEYYPVYLVTRGENPQKNSELKRELDRLKASMMRLKEVSSTGSTPTRYTNTNRLDVAAAKRIIKHELWDPNSSRSEDSSGPPTKKMRSN